MTTYAEKEILNPNEVMELLGISRATLQRLKKRGDLPSYKFSGKIYFKRSEIMAAVDAGKEERQLNSSEEA